MAYWDSQQYEAIIHVINNTCAFPALKSTVKMSSVKSFEDLD